MSPAAVPSGYAPDALLLCLSCGALGPEAKIYPHIGPNPECTDPLVLVSSIEAEGLGYDPVGGGVFEVDTESDAFEAIADIVDAAEADADPEEEAAATAASVSARSLGTANARTGTVTRTRPSRAHKGMKVNLPARGQAAKTVRPDPVTVSVTVKVSLYTLALFDVARQEESIAFDGTLEDFLDECPQALFDMMDYDGLFLVKRNQAMISRLEASDPRIRRGGAVEQSQGVAS